MFLTCSPFALYEDDDDSSHDREQMSRSYYGSLFAVHYRSDPILPDDHRPSVLERNDTVRTPGQNTQYTVSEKLEDRFPRLRLQ